MYFKSPPGLAIYKEITQENGESCLFKGQSSSTGTEFKESKQNLRKFDVASGKRKREDSVDEENKKRRVSSETDSVDFNEALALLEDSFQENNPRDRPEILTYQENGVSNSVTKRSKSKRRRERRKNTEGQTKDIRGKRCLFK